MRPELTRALLALSAVGAAIVAAVAAGAAGEWAAAGAAIVAASSASMLAATLVRSRASVRIRPDLGRWLDERAAMTGESRDVLADRALAMQRDRLGETEAER